jgi:hypothetical protein
MHWCLQPVHWRYTEIGQLKNLRSIALFLCSDYSIEIAEGFQQLQGHVDSMVSSLCKPCQLHSLSINVDSADRLMHQSESGLEESASVAAAFEHHKRAEKVLCLDSVSGAAPLGLRRFHMTGGYIYKVPNWIRSLTDLQLLTLHVNELEAQDVLALGRLPALVSLRLTAHESFRGARVRIGGLDGFPSLRSLEFRCAVPVSFGAGAMPRLGKLSLKFYPLSTDMLMLTSNGEEYRRKI